MKVAAKRSSVLHSRGNEDLNPKLITSTLREPEGTGTPATCHVADMVVTFYGHPKSRKREALRAQNGSTGNRIWINWELPL